MKKLLKPLWWLFLAFAVYAAYSAWTKDFEKRTGIRLPVPGERLINETLK
jgi:4-hydroxybenzoate polyprenyltransferase